MLKLDFSITSPEERNKLVTKIIEQTPPEQLTKKYLEILADYIIFAMDKEERKKKNILTDNRMVTVNKRETSFQGLACKLEKGEDGIYSMIANDKNIIFTPKIQITPRDIEEIPALKELREAIAVVEKQERAATGKKRYSLKKQLIEMRKDQYVIKNLYHPCVSYTNGVRSFTKIDLNERITIDADGEVHSNCLISLFDPKHVSALLRYYSKLKEEAYGAFWCDSYFLMMDLDTLVDAALKDKYPLYYDIVIHKIDGLKNTEIKQLLKEKHGNTYTPEYISNLWRNKIPKLVAREAADRYLTWYYTIVERGQWKRCSRCGQYKLAHNRFFSKNNTSKDGFYSICKECRNSKRKRRG